ncbi:MAG: hydroxymethylglutaryl-CoA reductase [Flavobacteriales bacterium]|nr:hydroxymethylglutaryl-CoA reductase [Flavobacteriales bacterium]
MSASLEKAKKNIEKLVRNNKLGKLSDDVKNRIMLNRDDSLQSDEQVCNAGQIRRMELVSDSTGKNYAVLRSNGGLKDLAHMQGNIENYIGMTMIPTGVIGPVSVLGSEASGEFFVPMATSQGSLVAAYNRGAKACRLAGGITSVCVSEGVQRCPVFKFNDLSEVMNFLHWVLQQEVIFRKISAEESRFAELSEMKAHVEGNHVILTFEFNTGDAAGQNIITFCADAICKYIEEKSPVTPKEWFVEGNFSGEKKATINSFVGVRGKKVSAEVLLPKSIVTSVLKTTPERLEEYWRTSTLGVIQSGAIGAQGHVANGLAAIFMACGQDVACVSEASVGITRMERTQEGDIYASVTLPNLIVGTVGGGTHLPSQRECLEMMDCLGAGKSRKFAEIITAVVLGGELSISAALSAGHYAKAHKELGRKKI